MPDSDQPDSARDSIVSPPDFRVEIANWDADQAALRKVREDVFIIEQQVPLEEEWDELDARSLHVLARDPHGAPIGTGRLTPEHKIGRMAVLAAWRGKGVGDAILRTLIEAARDRHWPEVKLHAQVHAIPFYGRAGFVAEDEEFMEAGIAHRVMALKLEPREAAVRAGDALADDGQSQPLAALTSAEAQRCVDAVIGGARHKAWIYTRDLDGLLLDREETLERLKRLALSGRGAEIRILVHDVKVPLRDGHRLIHLMRRLPSFIQVRTPVVEEDRQYPSAFVVNDTGGFFLRSLATRFDGEGNLRARGKARQLTDYFNQVWERSEPDPELRQFG